MKVKIFSIVIVFIFSTIFSTVGYSKLTKEAQEKITKEGKKVVVTDVFTPDFIQINYSIDEEKDVKAEKAATKEEKIYVKLLGIILPPADSKAYKSGLKFMKSWTTKKNVYICNDEIKEESGIQLGYIYYKDISYLANATLLKRGLAKLDNSYPMWLKDEFIKLENEAKENKRGYWGEGNFDDVKSVSLKEYVEKFAKASKDEKSEDVTGKSTEKKEKIVPKKDKTKAKADKSKKKTGKKSSKKSGKKSANKGKETPKEIKLNTPIDPKVLADITLELNDVKNSSKDTEPVFKKFNITSEEYYSAVHNMANNKDYLNALNKKIKSN